MPGTQTGYGKIAGRGVLWMLLSTLITKGASFGAQVVLGWVLFKEEFGLYAIALSVTSFMQVLKDGGTRKIIVQKGQRRFRRLSPPVFWIATAFNALTALVIAAIAIPAARIYEDPQLIPMMLIIALGTLLSSPDMMFRAKLSVEMRYRELSRLQTLSGLVRFGSMILLAVLGAGATSFVWPMVIQVVFGWALGWWMCGGLGVFASPRFRLWPTLVCTTIWMLVGSGGLTVLRMGPYAILGLFHPQGVLAIYFFAYQLLVQIEVLVAYNIQSVLLPTLSAMRDQAERHSTAVLRTTGALTLAGSVAGMGFGVAVPDIVRFIWGEKWVDAAPAVQWMALVFPFRMLQSVFEPAVLSRGMYRSWAGLMIFQGVIVIVASLIAGVFLDEPWQFAIVVGSGFTLSMAIAGLWGGRLIRLAPSRILATVLPAWFVVALAYGLVIWGRRELLQEGACPRWCLVLQGAGSVCVFGVASALLLRALLPDVCRDALGLLPQVVRKPIGRIAMLREVEAHGEG